MVVFSSSYGILGGRDKLTLSLESYLGGSTVAKLVDASVLMQIIVLMYGVKFIIACVEFEINLF